MIEVQVLDNQGFIWKTEDVLKLRKDYRIVGTFLGVTPKNLDTGLPLIISEEEMQLSKEKNLVRLYEVKSWTSEPSEQTIQKVLEYKEQSYQSQIEEFKEERKEVILKMADKIVAGKRKKLNQMKYKGSELKKVERNVSYAEGGGIEALLEPQI